MKVDVNDSLIFLFCLGFLLQALIIYWTGKKRKERKGKSLLYFSVPFRFAHKHSDNLLFSTVAHVITRLLLDEIYQLLFD